MPEVVPTLSNFQKATRPTPRLSILHNDGNPAVKHRMRVVVLDLSNGQDRIRWEKILNDPCVTVLKDQEHALKTQILTYVRYMEEIPEPASTVDDLWPE